MSPNLDAAPTIFDRSLHHENERRIRAIINCSDGNAHTDEYANRNLLHLRTSSLNHEHFAAILPSICKLSLVLKYGAAGWLLAAWQFIHIEMKGRWRRRQRLRGIKRSLDLPSAASPDGRTAHGDEQNRSNEWMGWTTTREEGASPPGTN